MGIIEFHFHDASFEFAPSVTSGGEPGAAESVEDAEESAAEESEHGAEEWTSAGGESKTGVGALVALVALVVLAGIVKWKRGGSEDEPASEDEEIQIQE